MTEQAVICRGLGREYGAIQALAGVDLDLPRGEIHALVGENGAGKSTLLGILAGRVVPTTGTVDLFDEPLPFGDPRRIRKLGVAAIYQELTIVPALSAVANAFLGQELRKGVVRDDARMAASFASLSKNLGVQILPSQEARTLPIAEQQLVEILRGLISRARLLLLDEPTAALPEQERDALLRVLRQLRQDGVTIVIASHNLDEVLSLSDKVTVLRNGRLVATAPVGDWTKPKLVASMLGRGLDRPSYFRRNLGEDIFLDARGITVPGAIESISFSIRRGEVLGLAGLVGSGRSTLLRALAGLEPTATGTLAITGRKRHLPRTIRDALRLGLVLLPEDRKTGLVLGMPVADNITLGRWGEVSTFGVLNSGRQHALTQALAARFGFSSGRTKERAGRLSGGNQQKVLLAKCVHHDPQVLLADEPTRGIDVGAKADVLRTLRELAASGLSVVVASSELEEVLEISDRVLIMHAGRAMGEIQRDDPDWSAGGVLHHAFQVRSQG